MVLLPLFLHPTETIKLFKFMVDFRCRTIRQKWKNILCLQQESILQNICGYLSNAYLSLNQQVIS